MKRYLTRPSTFTFLTKMPTSLSSSCWLRTMSRYYSSKFFFGFDVNSKSTGYTILNENAKAIDCGVINTKDCNNIHEFGMTVKSKLIEMKDFCLNSNQQGNGNTVTEKDQIEWVIGVENFLQRFSTTKSKASTITLLCSCNTIVNYECFQIFQKSEPIPINATSARAFFNIKAPKKSSPISNQIMNMNSPLEDENIDNGATNDEDIISAFDINNTNVLSSASNYQKHLVFEMFKDSFPDHFEVRYRKKRNQKNRDEDVSESEAKNLFQGEKVPNLMNYDVTDSMLIAYYSYVKYFMDKELKCEKSFWNYVKLSCHQSIRTKGTSPFSKRIRSLLNIIERENCIHIEDSNLSNPFMCDTICDKLLQNPTTREKLFKTYESHLKDKYFTKITTGEAKVHIPGFKDRKL